VDSYRKIEKTGFMGKMETKSKTTKEKRDRA
jgi:hypothetical protein